jgi:hypothetical protein
MLLNKFIYKKFYILSFFYYFFLSFIIVSSANFRLFQNISIIFTSVSSQKYVIILFLFFFYLLKTIPPNINKSSFDQVPKHRIALQRR